MDHLQAMANDVPETLANHSAELSLGLRKLFGDSAPFLVPDARHLIVIADGWLSALPFELLPVERSSSRLMIESVDVWYLPSAVLLGRKTPNQRWLKFPWSRQLSAFGDPTLRLSAEAESDDANQRALPPLPGSAKEVREIAAMANGRKLIFLGPANTRSNFTGGPANESSLLHVSTHAIADVVNPENSRMVFSPDNSGQNASYVFLRELYEMNFRNVLMAVISACDTEKGKVVRGEGVQGFSRALLSVGAQSTVTTLWRVDDEATAEFMRQFYYHAVEEHRPRAEALRLAKLTFLHSSQYSDPRYWAAFVLSGEGRTPLPRVLSWTTLLLLAGNCYVAAMLLWWLGVLRRRRIDRGHGERRVVAEKS
jgi:CHAT domain-containing protein